MASFSFDHYALERLARCATAAPTPSKKPRVVKKRERAVFISVPSIPARGIARDADGAPLNLNDLPPPNFAGYWTARRKSIVAHAVHGGLLSEEEAFRRYTMSPEELNSWERAFVR